MLLESGRTAGFARQQKLYLEHVNLDGVVPAPASCAESLAGAMSGDTSLSVTRCCRVCRSDCNSGVAGLGMRRGGLERAVLPRPFQNEPRPWHS